ncbi:MAG: class I SAM-dependent methyltransferase, partial [Acidimicrobiales bacterium]|nr:class I SAM-dependent methyltransferase [Acidimicrobiales bacterium]
EQGWKVTASDVSSQALSHVSALAAQRDLPIECIQADADGVEPFEPGGFDLVSAQYLPIPRSPDGRGLQNLIDAVAPGGTLLVVAHDLAAMRAHDGHHHKPLIDFEAYFTPEDFEARLAGSPEWEVEVHETRPRPDGHSTPHVEDVVLRARRRC